MKATAAFYEWKILLRQQEDIWSLLSVLGQIDEFVNNEHADKHTATLKEIEKNIDDRIRTIIGALETIDIDL